MLKSLRAGVLALAALLCIPAAALAACPTAPTYTGLTGQDAATATQTLQTITSASSSKQLPTPVMHGNDGTTTPKAVALDSSCNLDVNIQASTQLDTLHTDNTATTGTKAPGTAAANSQLIGGVYNSSPPTLTNGQQAAQQLDVNGTQKVTPCDSAVNCLAPGNVQSVSLSGAAATLMLAPATPTTYYFSKTGLALATGASDFLEIYGAGTLVTRILWIKASCVATAAATVDFSIIRRTTQLTGGTKSTVTPVPADNFLGFVNASSTVNVYTVNSSGGGLTSSGGGEIYSQKAYVGPITTPVATPTQVVFSGMDALTGNVPLLRANTQTLTLTANAGNGAGTVCDVAGAFTELSS